MSKTAFSVYIFGLYLSLGAGLPFLLVPDVALWVLGLATPDTLWVRMFGTSIAIMGGFYILAVHYDLEQLYGWTVPARYLTAGFALLMVVLGKVGPTFLIASAIDALGASLTWLALRHEGAQAVADGPAG